MFYHNKNNSYKNINDRIAKHNDAVDEKLLEMDNPYDREARVANNVDFHWDHAFYNGKYYMYFGIVPALILFVPFKLITGKTLITYHATQIFVSFLIIGIYMFFLMLLKVSKKKITTPIFIFSCVSLSIMSVWYMSSAPSLYCTAISAGICFVIWSLYFFFKAAYVDKNKSILLATIGSIFGALAFGCRPPIALANVIAIPLYIHYLKGKRISIKFILKNLIIFLPYVIVGVGIMYYNYIRFDNVFEFGQSYQLTVTDQTNYANIFDNFGIYEILKAFYFYGLKPAPYYDFLNTGCLITYPIILCVLIVSLKNKIYKNIVNSEYFGLLSFCALAIIIIIIFDTLCSPYPLPRYRLDFMWIISIFLFILILMNGDKLTKKDCYWIVLTSFITIIMCVAMFFVPLGENLTEYYWPTSIDYIIRILTFNICKY